MNIELNIIETFNKMSVSEKQAFLIKLFGKSYFIAFRLEVAKPYFYLVVCMQVYIFVSSINN